MRDALRIVVIVLGSIAGVIAIAGGLFFFFLHHFYFDPPKANFAKPASALEAQRQDIAYFRTLTKLDRSFSPEARAEADARIDRLAQLSTVMPQPKLHVALMQIMALADNGHTKLRASIASQKMSMEPVRVSRFAEGFFVMRAKPEYRDMLGGRVEKIDGVPFAEILKKLETLHGGTEAFRAENAAAFIEFPDILYGVGIAHDPDRSTWTVRMADGSEVTRVLTAYEEKAGMSIPYGPRWRSPEPLKAMGADWVSYRRRAGRCRKANAISTIISSSHRSREAARPMCACRTSSIRMDKRSSRSSKAPKRRCALIRPARSSSISEAMAAVTTRICGTSPMPCRA